MVKDDGLAAGKGVVVTDDRAAALEHAPGLPRPSPDGAVVIEEFLAGPEVSLFCLSDGTTRRAAVPGAGLQAGRRRRRRPEHRRHGRLLARCRWAPEGLVDEVVARVAQPAVDEMRRRGTPFAGVLYVGLALTPRGPRVIEFNARFGDPETQVVLARLRTPLGGLLLAAAHGRAATRRRRCAGRTSAAVTVVVAADNYPGTPAHRRPDHRAGRPAGRARGYVLHAGTARDDDGRGRRAGGRVLSVVAHRRRPRRGPRAASTRAVDGIDLPGLAPPHRHRAARRARRGHRLRPDLPGVPEVAAPGCLASVAGWRGVLRDAAAGPHVGGEVG